MRRKGRLNGSEFQPAAASTPALRSSGTPTITLVSRLTGAENRVLALLTQAKTNKEIARDLGISPATVKRHLENVLRKLGVRNRVEAAIYGILVNGCAAGVSSRCPLQKWRKDWETTPPAWAD